MAKLKTIKSDQRRMADAVPTLATDMMGRFSNRVNVRVGAMNPLPVPEWVAAEALGKLIPLATKLAQGKMDGATSTRMRDITSLIQTLSNIRE